MRAWYRMQGLVKGLQKFGADFQAGLAGKRPNDGKDTDQAHRQSSALGRNLSVSGCTTVVAEDAHVPEGAWPSNAKAISLEVEPSKFDERLANAKDSVDHDESKRSSKQANLLDNYDSNLMELVAHKGVDKVRALTIQNFDFYADTAEIGPAKLPLFTKAITCSSPLASGLKHLTLQNQITTDTAQQLLDKLSSLEHASLFVFHLGTRDPVTFASFPSGLKHLALKRSSNGYSSMALQDWVLVDCAALARCKQLQTLKLLSLGLKSEGELGKCKQLQELQLTCWETECVPGLVEALAQLPSLRVLGMGKVCLSAAEGAAAKWPEVASLLAPAAQWDE